MPAESEHPETACTAVRAEVQGVDVSTDRGALKGQELMCNVQKACYDQEGLLNKSAGETGSTQKRVLANLANLHRPPSQVDALLPATAFPLALASRFSILSSSLSLRFASGSCPHSLL